MDHGHRADLRRRWAAVASAVGLTIAATGCGAAEGADATGAPVGPTIADPAYAGTWSVTDLTAGGGGAAGPLTARIELETDFGGVAVDTSCGSELGAFTLDADGAAGFSLVGGSTRECSAADQQGRDALVAALAAVTAWSETDDGILLSSPGGDGITLTR